MPPDSDNESFKSADDGGPAAAPAIEPFPPEEEAALLAASNESKTRANTLFGTAAYSEAIQAYDKALASCPRYLDYEVAVLHSNISASQLKLRDWQAAIDAASASLACLERLDPAGGTGEAVEEVDDAAEARIAALQASGHSRDEVQRLRVKALLRRARAREERGGWMGLQGADEDYRALGGMRELSALDRAAVQRALGSLPARLDAAKKAEMGEMLGKLKDLGNGFLKPFGLSTDNFQFTPDEKGGYSMNFNQGGK